MANASQSAYETLYALMETVFPRINTLSFHDRVISGLRDEADIRALCNLMVAKLATIDPDETARRLDAIAEAYRAVLSTKLKDGAVKQDVEKHSESVRGVLRVSGVLQERFGDGSGQWGGFWEWVAKEFGAELKGLREEVREMRREGGR